MKIIVVFFILFFSSPLYANEKEIVLFEKGIDYLDVQDYENAFKYFFQSAEMGYEKAIYNIALMYERGMGVERNYQLAIKYYSELIDSSNEEWATSAREAVVELDKILKINYFCTDARSCQEYADANNTDLRANYEAGTQFELEKNYTKAIKYFKIAANLGHGPAAHNLGYTYHEGLGDIKKDFEEAFKWYSLAIENNITDSMVNLGYMYLYGDGVEINYEKAKEYFLNSIKEYNDHPLGYYAIGIMYEEGLGVEKNLGMLGINYAKVNEEIAADFNLPNTKGYYVISSNPIGPAFEVGIKEGDVILKANDFEGLSTSDMSTYIENNKAGSIVSLEIRRQKKIIKMDIKLMSKALYYYTIAGQLGVNVEEELKLLTTKDSDEKNKVKLRKIKKIGTFTKPLN